MVVVSKSYIKNHYKIEMNGNTLSLNSFDVGSFNGIYSLENLKNELKRELKEEIMNEKSSKNVRNIRKETNLKSSINIYININIYNCY